MKYILFFYAVKRNARIIFAEGIIDLTGKLYNFLKSVHKKDLFKDPHGQKLPEIKHKPFE